MSGGGSFGSFEAGALYGMWHQAKNKADYEYDVVTGISAGGLNAFGVSMFEKGDEEKMVQWLSDLWAHLKSSDVWQLYPVKDWGHLIGLLDTKPLEHTVTKLFDEFDHKIKKKLTVACADT